MHTFTCSAEIIHCYIQTLQLKEFQSIFFSLLKTNILTRLFWVLLPNLVHCTGRNHFSNGAPKSGVNPPSELPVRRQARSPIWYGHFKGLEVHVLHGYKRGLRHLRVQAYHTEARMVRDAPMRSHLLKNFGHFLAADALLLG